MILSILFFASLLGLAGMLYMRVWQMRSGEAYELHKVSSRLPDVSIQSVRETATTQGKRFGHLFVLILLKIWIKTRYFIKRRIKELEPKIKNIIRKRVPEMEKQSKAVVSEFLSNISAYKKKLKHAHEQMKKEEEEKDSETGNL